MFQVEHYRLPMQRQVHPTMARTALCFVCFSLGRKEQTALDSYTSRLMDGDEVQVEHKVEDMTSRTPGRENTGNYRNVYPKYRVTPPNSRLFDLRITSKS